MATTYMGMGPLRHFTGSKSSVQTSVPAPTSLRADVPLATVGGPVPYVLGRRRVSKPNVIGYGNLRALTQTTTETKTVTRTIPGSYVGAIWTPAQVVEETITTETTIPIGFLTDIVVGICLGPNVVLKGIFAGTEMLWSGTAGPARTIFTLGESETAFSGCEVAFNGGAFDQGVDPWLTEPDTPAYVGIAYIILRGMRADMSLDALSFEVERFVNPLGLSGANNRLDDDINCATAIYDILTSEWGGAGISPNYIDHELGGTLRAAAAIFAAEANYCSIIIDAETKATAVLSALQAQTYSIVYQNPSTGKIEVRPIRQGANLAGVKNFGSSNTIAINSYNKSAWADTIEVLRGIYVERANDYEPTPVMVQNISSLSTTGRNKRSSETNYPYITKGDLTLFVTSRDLAYMTIPRTTATLLTNRDGADCLPGDIVTVSERDYGLWGLPMLVSKVRKAPMKENTVLLTLEEYASSNTSPIYDTPENPYDPGINYSPQTPLGALAITSPFWIAARARGLSPESTSNVVFPLIMPIPANNIQSYYDVYINNVPGVGQSQAQTGGLYATYGTLSNAINKYDGFNNGELASIVIDSVINPVYLDTTYTADNQRSGRPLVFIGNEIFSFTSATLIAPGQYELTGVRRALIDTVPIDHAQGANVFIVDGAEKNLVPVAFPYPLSYTPQWRIVSSTINEKGKYADALALASWNSANMPRTLRPVRPHDTRIDGVRAQTARTLAIGQQYSVSWRTRNRGSLTIPFQTDAAQNSEGTTEQNVIFHRVYIRDSGNVLRLCGATTDSANANSLVVTIPDTVAPGDGTLFVRSVNQYGESLFDDTLPVSIYPGSPAAFSYEIET